MGKSAHLRAEIDRLRIAASDMKEAAGGAMHLGEIRAGRLDRMYGFADRALETGVIVSYARPFTRHGIGRLDPALWEPDDEASANLHRELIRLRNVRYAHTDKTDLRGTEDVFGTGHFSEAWASLSDEAWPRIEALALAQAVAFDALADELQGVLKTLPES